MNHFYNRLKNTMDIPISTKRKALFYLRFCIASFLTYLILQWVDFTAALAAIANADIRYVVGVIIVNFFDRFLMAFKWAMLLRARGINLSNPEAFRIYMASGFIGILVPLGIGNDIFRVLRTTARGRTIDRVTASIVMERAIGLLALTSLCLLGLFFVVKGHDSQFNRLYYSVWGFLSILMIVLFLTMQTWTFHLVRRLLTWLEIEKYKPSLMLLDLHRAYMELSHHREVLLLFFVLSFFEHGLQCLMSFWGAKAMSLPIGMIYFFAIVPFSILGGMLPISFSGIGVTEGVFVVLFVWAGLSPTESLSLSVLMRMIGFIMLIPGGLVFFYDSVRFRRLQDIRQQ